MKTMIRIALFAVSIGSIGTAYADDGEGPIANTQFNQLPRVVAQAPARRVSPVAGVQNGSGNALFVTHQQGHSAFPWNPNAGSGG